MGFRWATTFCGRKFDRPCQRLGANWEKSVRLVSLTYHIFYVLSLKSYFIFPEFFPFGKFLWHLLLMSFYGPLRLTASDTCQVSLPLLSHSVRLLCEVVFFFFQNLKTSVLIAGYRNSFKFKISDFYVFHFCGPAKTLFWNAVNCRNELYISSNTGNHDKT